MEEISPPLVFTMSGHKVTERKTIFTRFQDIQEGAIDSEGMGINNVEEALERVNIKLRDSDTSFRDFSDVLKDLYNVWGSINEIEKANIAKALAGTRQRENLLILLENETLMQKLLNEQIASGGLGLQRYGAYLESVEGSSKELTATWEEMWQESINPQTIIFVQNLATSFLKLINNVGGVAPALTAIVSIIGIIRAQQLGELIISWVASISKFITSIKTATISLKTLQLAMSGGTGVGLAIAATTLAITGIVVAYKNWSERSTIAAEKAKELREEMDRLRSGISRIQNETKTVEELWNSYEELGKVLSKTIPEQEEFTQIQNDLKDLLPEINGYYDAQGDFIIDSTVNLEKLLELKREELDIEKEKLKIAAEQEISENKKVFDIESDKIRGASELLETLENRNAPEGSYAESVIKEEIKNAEARVKEAGLKVREARLNIIQSFASLNKEEQRVFLENLDITKEYNQELKKELEFTYFAIEDTEKRILNTFKNTGDGVVEQFKGLLSVVQSLQKSTNILWESIRKAEEGTFNFEDMGKLLEYDKELIKYMIVQDGQVKLNTRGLQEYNIAKAEAALQSARNSEATAEEILVLDNYLKQLKQAYEDPEQFNQVIFDEKALEDQKKSVQELIDMVVKKIKQEKEEQKKALEDQLDGYKKIIDARKKILDSMEEERKYQKELAERNKDISSIQNELAELSLDNSEEGHKRKLELQDDLAEKQSDLDDFQQEYSVDKQKEALDTDYDNFKDQIDSKVEVIEEYLSKTGEMTSIAIEMINDQSSTLFQSLIEWNKLYGTGVTEDVTKAWQGAYDILEKYKNSLGQIDVETFLKLNEKEDVKNQVEKTGGSYGSIYDQDTNTGYDIDKDGYIGNPNNKIEVHHGGVKSGFVGNQSLSKSSEVFAKLMKGEIVPNREDMDRFIGKTLPSLAGLAPSSVTNNSRMGNISIDRLMDINVQGNLDKSAIPNLERLSEQMFNKFMKVLGEKGVLRDSTMFA